MDTAWPRWRKKRLTLAYPITMRRGAVMAVAQARLAELSQDIESSSPVTRRKARDALVELGKPVVPTLIQLLAHRNPHVRWEAAKMLGQIADPIAATGLVGALEDEERDVRWLAAEGLAALGEDALDPLLAAMIQRAGSDWLCEGVHHVCHVLASKRKLGPILLPLLAALKDSEPEAAAPLAAYAALTKLRESR